MAAPVWPVQGVRVGQRWRPLKTPKRGRHLGIDLPTRVGTPVRAPWAGSARVLRSLSDAGCFLQLHHVADGGEPFFVELLHLSGFAVSAGENFAAGDIVAESGNTGTASTGPHVHLQVLVSGAWLRAYGADLEAGRDYIVTKAGAYLNPLLLLGEAEPPAAISGDIGVEDVIAALGAGPPPKYKIKAWCRWQGTQAAFQWLAGAGVLAALFGWGPFRRRPKHGTS